MHIPSTQQSLADLIEEYLSTGEELRTAIEQNSTELVQQLDHRMSALFDTLLNFSPMNVEDALELTKFLLERLVLAGEETTLSEQKKAKIVSIVEAGFDRNAGAVEQ